jgi:hypothetical protein
LHEALKAVARQGSDGAEQSDQEEAQSVSIPAPAQHTKKLLVRAAVRSHRPRRMAGAVMANSIAIWFAGRE